MEQSKIEHILADVAICSLHRFWWRLGDWASSYRTVSWRRVNGMHRASTMQSRLMHGIQRLPQHVQLWISLLEPGWVIAVFTFQLVESERTELQSSMFPLSRRAISCVGGFRSFCCLELRFLLPTRLEIEMLPRLVWSCEAMFKFDFPLIWI